MLTRLRSPDAAARWLREWTTGVLRTDSRQVEPGDAFIAWPGYSTDGRRFAQAALAAGAATCLVEAEGVEAYGFDDARIGALPGLKAAAGAIADAYFDHPSAHLRVIAATGTNGKTSTTWWTAQALSLLGRRCGVVGTLGIGEPPLPAAVGEPPLPAAVGEPPLAAAVGEPPLLATAGEPPRGEQEARIEFTGLTTPDPVTLQRALRGMADAGFAACAIEASSIGLNEQRLAALRIEVALFTNFTRDHLDYHGGMDAYWAAKRELFAWPGLKAAVVNLDDPLGAPLAASLRERLDLWTYAIDRDDARLRARSLGYTDVGLAFLLQEGGEALPVQSRLIGDYNASNLLAVLGGLRALGVSLADAASVVPKLTPVPGRMQRVVMSTPRSPDTASTSPGAGEPGQPEVVVDYAHSPDALEKALIALRPLARARGGRLWCVFGCGGNRDPSKRPLMGAIAQRLADRVIVTSDNPRNEAADQILAEIVVGQDRRDRALVIEDRRVAISQALAQADAHDVVLIAGKGHEDYQEVAGVMHPFSDVAEARQALAARRDRR